MDLKQRSVQRSALAAATVTSFMAPFMISAVNVALPAIQKEFGIDAVVLSWVATAYLLATAIILVPMGRIADIYGRKKIFMAGQLIFTLACLLTALAPSISVLIFLRVLQGVGSAMVVTTGMAILTSVFEPRQRGKAIGISVSAVYVGLSLGPFVGGILTQHLGWRSIFILAAPIGAASIAITWIYLKGEWADARGEAFDMAGSVMYGLALVLIIYGATRLPQMEAVYLIVPGIICLVAFVVRQLKGSSPVFDVRLFADNKLFAFSSMAALIHYAATFAVTFLMSLYLQYVKGMSPQGAGIILVAQPVCMALFSSLAGKFSDVIEPRRIASVGMAQTALGLFLLRLIGPDTSTAYIVVVLMILGTGFALFSSPNMNAIMSSVAKRHYGIASGSVATMRLIGQMLSMAIATVVFAILIGQVKIGPQNYAQLMQSIKICLLISAIMCSVGVFFSLFRGDLHKP